MSKTSLKEFLDTIREKFPNLKGYDETRLFAMLMQSGLDVEFDLDADGNSMVSYGEINAEIEQKLKQF